MFDWVLNALLSYKAKKGKPQNNFQRRYVRGLKALGNP